MDHRARKEADFINSKNHKVLKNVGGKISLEMETPKILWLKNNLPKEKFWNKVGRLFDLPDFLTWKATDAFSRSVQCVFYNTFHFKVVLSSINQIICILFADHCVRWSANGHTVQNRLQMATGIKRILKKLA